MGFSQVRKQAQNALYKSQLCAQKRFSLSCYKKTHFLKKGFFLIIKCLRHSLGLILREMSDTQRDPLHNQELTRKP